MGVCVGIDLGTTNSAVARRDPFGRPAVLPNREGHAITPSVIYFGVDPPAVGEEAREWSRLGNAEIASFFKPHMGSPHYRLQFHGRDYDATALSALVLARLKEDAEARLDTAVDRAVITVPAYFADAQRKATLEAGRLAGLEVLRLINEPTAAALAYGLGQTGAAETVMVYDLGGGTFDVTVARIEPDAVHVLATAGDHDLGGKNWDDRVASFLAEKFAADTGVDPLDDPVTLNEVLNLAEQAKWALSGRAATRITLQVGRDRRSYELSRTEFEGMTAALMDRTRRLAEEALAEAKLGWNEVGSVLLVGGSTRMPMVRTTIRAMSGKDPRAGVNVDEAVALGAAIQAGIEEGEATAPAVPRFTLGGQPVAPSPAPAGPSFTLPGARAVVDVMAHSLGAVAVSPDGTRYVNDILLGRNRPIPAEGRASYLHATHGGANTTLEVFLTQGESPAPLDCTILGKYRFDGIQATDREVRIEVQMAYDRNGVVQVRAVQADTGHALRMTVEPVPADLAWLGRPPETATSAAAPSTPTRIFLLIDVSASMAGTPLMKAQDAARAFLNRCDFTTTEVGLISFSDTVTLQADCTDNPRKVLAGLTRLEADGTTNLADALELARNRMLRIDRTRYLVILTDGYPDAAEAAVEQAARARNEGIEIVAIGTGDADLAYLRRLASTEEGSIFSREADLSTTFGHIARVIAEGGRSLRKLS